MLSPNKHNHAYFNSYYQLNQYQHGHAARYPDTSPDRDLDSAHSSNCNRDIPADAHRYCAYPDAN